MDLRTAHADIEAAADAESPCAHPQVNSRPRHAAAAVPCNHCFARVLERAKYTRAGTVVDHCSHTGADVSIRAECRDGLVRAWEYAAPALPPKPERDAKPLTQAELSEANAAGQNLGGPRTANDPNKSAAQAALSKSLIL